MNWFRAALAKEPLSRNEYSAISLSLPGMLNPRDSLQCQLRLQSRVFPECSSWVGKWFVRREDTSTSLGIKSHIVTDKLQSQQLFLHPRTSEVLKDRDRQTDRQADKDRDRANLDVLKVLIHR